MATRKSLDSKDQYTIGWIAALPSERAAAISMLDERHGKPLDFNQPITDPNSYTWGRIDEHNIVIASLSAGIYGIASATATALPMLSSFPHLRVGLMVGIGAGAPKEDNSPDIRLGDVVISKPTDNRGGIVQYDFGKIKSKNKWERKDVLNKPPEVLLKALSSMQADHIIQGSRIPEILADAVTRNPRLAKAGFTHPGAMNDRLFKVSYSHVSGADCHGCGADGLVQRPSRGSTDPEIHYGLIASGNTLIGDAIIRNAIVAEMGESILCFEMEAAGLMNNFPCLVIRGICDYADSHKNDKWQQYAAATAAALGKELLAYIPDVDVQRTSKAIDRLKDIAEDIQTTTIQTKTVIEKEHMIKLDEQVMSWLHPADSSISFNSARSRHHPETGSWLLEHHLFQKFQARQVNFLWLYGIPGCGKTILSSTVIMHLRHAKADCAVLYFFFDFRDPGQQTIDHLIRSLIAQLFIRVESCRDHLTALYEQCKYSTPSTEVLFKVFCAMVLSASEVYLVIDAMDECSTRSALTAYIRDACTSISEKLSVVATSRLEADLESQICMWANKGCSISLQQKLVDPDIANYTHTRLHANDGGFRRWHSQPWVLVEIETELTEKAAGMFRWVALQLDELQHCINIVQLRKAIRNLPQTLNETYGRILANIPRQHEIYAIRILQLLIYSKRRLALQEVVDAIVVNADERPHFDVSWRMPNPREIINSCSSLVSIVGGKLSEMNLDESSWGLGYQLGLESKLGEIPESESELEDMKLIESKILPKARSKKKRKGKKGKKGSKIKGESKAQGYHSYKEKHREEKKREWELLQLAHFSVREYLVSGALEGSFKTELQEIYARKTITRVCLAYMTNLEEEVKMNYLNNWTDSYRSLRENVQQSIKRDFPFAGYSAGYWMDHANHPLVLDDMGSQIRNFIFRQSEVYRLSLEISEPLTIFEDWLMEDPQPRLSRSLSYLILAEADAVVEFILSYAADATEMPDWRENLGEGLIAASRNGNLPLVQKLLVYGADVNYYGEGWEIPSPLLAACYLGHDPVVQVLLDYGAFTNTPSRAFPSALDAVECCQSWSVNHLHDDDAHKRSKIRQMLHKVRTDCAMEPEEINSALIRASRWMHKERIHELLEAGADINARDEEYCTALINAVNDCHVNIVQFLLNAGADVNAEGGPAGSALVAASACNYACFQEKFIDEAKNAHLEIIQILLDAGANINAKVGNLGPALVAASAQGNWRTAELLLRFGAEVDAQGELGTALIAALVNGHRETARTLLHAGANVYAGGAGYSDAISAARNKEHIMLVKWLKKHILKLKKRKLQLPASGANET